jgi:hypothetical protein
LFVKITMLLSSHIVELNVMWGEERHIQDFGGET